MNENLEILGYKEMTQIQELSLPLALQGDDLIAQAKTGSGKTVAFGLPILMKIDVKNFKPQALIICPTRELADQVANELRKLARFQHNIKIVTLAGGSPMRMQMRSLEHGAHIVVGTPGRLDDHLSKKTLSLTNIKIAVLDEADRMLDMGFVEIISKILSFASSNRQTLLFSATFPSDIKKLSAQITKSPKHIEVQSSHEQSVINQIFYEVHPSERFESLLKVLREYNLESCMIFCTTKIEVSNLAKELQENGFSALDLHGDLEQVDRDETLLQFANRSCAILVATDVAARGLDIKEVSMVINYELPRDDENYVHRIGRTGRAGSEGIAVSFFKPHEKSKILLLNEKAQIKSIKELNSNKINIIEAPMKTVCIHGGKKNKLRAGDILGSLTRDLGLNSKDIGKINITNFYAYVAVEKSIFSKKLKTLQKLKIKGKYFRIWEL